MKIIAALSILLSYVSLLESANAEDIIQIHGSGTTNPSKCIWHIMSLFNAQSRNPIRMTYRAVGSTMGQEEFLGVNNTDPSTSDDDADIFKHWPHTDFGAGDIPISSKQYNLLQEKGHPTGSAAPKMVHLPFALSSVAFFYKANGVDTIDLNGCLLAKIFNREITKWDDAEIVALNPSLATPAFKDLDITVCRRKNGSSSTSSITKYLNKKCSASWPSNKVGSVLTNWHPETVAVEGSGQMVTCINENNGAIGYIDSGHGWSESLQEISLQNADGNFVTSQYAFENGGITYAAADATTPASADADWGAVDFIDKSGKDTYPIVLMSYLYVRRDVSYINENNRGLLKLFLEAMYMDEYFGKCDKLAFAPPPTSIVKVAKEGIDNINWSFATQDDVDETNKWKFEISAQAFIGAGHYTISTKRESYQGVAIENILALESEELAKIAKLLELAEDELGYKKFTSHEAGQIDTAIILSAISFTMWSVLIIGLIVKKYVFNM